VLNAAWALVLTVGLQAGPVQPQADPWPDDRPFTRFLPNLGRDLRALPSIESAVIVGLGGIGTAAVHPSDDNLASWADRSGSSSYTAFGRVAGDGWTQAGAAVATYAVGRIAGNAQVTHVGSDLVRAQLLNGLLTRGLKLAVDRDRPTGGGHAFPSGHTTATFASASVLHGHYGWKAGIPAYALAGFVGWTRARDRAHWLSDVVFGATVGTIAGRTVTSGHRARAWSVVPSVTRGGVAVYVYRLEHRR